MKHLFIDDHEVEEIDNLARRLHQPRKLRDNVVIRPEYRWENISIQVRTTPVWLPDEGVFKMIYLTSAEGMDTEVSVDVTGAPAGTERFACYATSVDGVNWDKAFPRNVRLRRANLAKHALRQRKQHHPQRQGDAAGTDPRSP